MSKTRTQGIVERLTHDEVIQLARAIDHWRNRRDASDALDELRRALRQRTRQKIAELEVREL